jgi:hypothetical protein
MDAGGKESGNLEKSDIETEHENKYKPLAVFEY